jgi:hypothetical protein
MDNPLNLDDLVGDFTQTSPGSCSAHAGRLGWQLLNILRFLP